MRTSSSKGNSFNKVFPHSYDKSFNSVEMIFLKILNAYSIIQSKSFKIILCIRCSTAIVTFMFWFIMLCLYSFFRCLMKHMCAMIGVVWMTIEFKITKNCNNEKKIAIGNYDSMTKQSHHLCWSSTTDGSKFLPLTLEGSINSPTGA